LGESKNQPFVPIIFHVHIRYPMSCCFPSSILLEELRCPRSPVQVSISVGFSPFLHISLSEIGCFIP
jgi:hypothetical protein